MRRRATPKEDEMKADRWGSTSRRNLLAAAGAAAGSAFLLPGMAKGTPLEWGQAVRMAPAVQASAEELTIDLAVEPASLDPALVYESDGWSVVHSIYDSLVQLGPDGALEMVLAESMTQVDPLTWEIKLRPDITFHNGEPLNTASVKFSVDHILDPETGSQIASNFQAIKDVKEVDSRTVQLLLSAPAPWLPSLIAPWLVLLPPIYARDMSNDFANNPVGTGPYQFDRWQRGSRIVLRRNADYFGETAKGEPDAARVTFRFVPDATTRVTDIVSGTSQLVRAVPYDELETVAATAEVVNQPIAGCAFVRIPTDVAPFDNEKVRLALNHAVDVESIITSLLGGNGVRLPNPFVPGGLGYDENLAPHAYDPELAQQLLAEAGYPDGFSTRLAYTTGERDDLAAAIAGQLEASGIHVELEPVETAEFNATWQDPDSAPLRLLTWRPLFDPFTLLSLVISNTGFLSRYDNPQAQSLIEAGAIDPDPEERNRIYRELGAVLHDSPAGIYLWSLTSFYGLDRDAPPWTPRADDWILPLVAGGES
jgi:peptide/nickel transport system substrate-binding protein